MAKASRMSMERQWRNMGAQAARRGMKVEEVTTGRPAIDAWIREGFAGKVNPRGLKVAKDIEAAK